MKSTGSSERGMFARAAACLRCADPTEKSETTKRAAAAFRAGELCFDDATPVEPIGNPGRPSRPALVPPKQLPQRGLGTPDGRAALVHAVAHIEFNAINLAWDAVYRFRGMPIEYYADWISVADDEARHFRLLRARLNELGHDYGDFDAHDGLWEMAVKTSNSCLERMALVPRVLEARGLDVTPGMIARFRHAQRRCDGRHPRDHPARRSRARRRGLALVRVVLRTRRPRSGANVRRTHRAARTRLGARTVQYRRAHRRRFHARGIAAARSGGMMRRAVCAAFIAGIWLIVLGFAAGLVWTSPPLPSLKLPIAARDFRVVQGAGVEDGTSMRIGSVGDDGSALQAVSIDHLSAADFPVLRYRFDGFPRTLELSFFFRRADAPDDVQPAVTVPWPDGGWQTIDLSKVPGWRGEIIEMGFSEYPTPQLAPTSVAFQPFRFDQVGTLVAVVARQFRVAVHIVVHVYAVGVAVDQRARAAARSGAGRAAGAAAVARDGVESRCGCVLFALAVAHDGGAQRRRARRVVGCARSGLARRSAQEARVYRDRVRRQILERARAARARSGSGAGRRTRAQLFRFAARLAPAAGRCRIEIRFPQADLRAAAARRRAVAAGRAIFRGRPANSSFCCTAIRPGTTTKSDARSSTAAATASASRRMRFSAAVFRHSSRVVPVFEKGDLRLYVRRDDGASRP